MPRVFLAITLWMALTCSAQVLFEYDHRLPFDVQLEPKSLSTEVDVKYGSFQIMRDQRMNFALVEPVKPPKAKTQRPAIVFQPGRSQSMTYYMGEAETLAKSGAICLITDAPERSK